VHEESVPIYSGFERPTAATSLEEARKMIEIIRFFVLLLLGVPCHPMDAVEQLNPGK